MLTRSATAGFFIHRMSEAERFFQCQLRHLHIGNGPPVYCAQPKSVVSIQCFSRALAVSSKTALQMATIGVPAATVGKLSMQWKDRQHVHDVNDKLSAASTTPFIIKRRLPLLHTYRFRWFIRHARHLVSAKMASQQRC